MHDIFIINHGNKKTTDLLLEKFPHAQCIDFSNRKSLYQTVAGKSVTKFSLVLDDRYDYKDFDFNYTPPWHQQDQIHVWQTDTVLINNKFILKNINQYENIQDFEYICWHKESLPLVNIPDIVIWDLGGQDQNVNLLKELYPTAKVLRYFGTHFEMMKKSCNYVNTKDFWVLSSCCDYTNFNPSWKPLWEQENAIHCWASGSQKFGDTFYVNKQNFLSQHDAVDKLEYVDSIYWIEQGYPRLPWPINYSVTDDLYTTLKQHKFSTIYEYFVMPGSSIGSTVEPSLWEKRSLIAYNRNGHISLCPRDSLSTISAKVKDYPYIQYHECKNSTQKSQDIVFISYDEKDADLNYKILKDRFPTAKRVHGIKGNVMAYKEAAKISSTPWYYAVFPKTKIDSNFNFDIHPNYLDTPGHYIFNAYNVITDYTYGHGGVKMYHVKTTIEIENWGYDFTMSSPVTTIPINSCYLDPATEYEAWRTSFREALKLKTDNSIEGCYRLHRWLTVGNGEFGEYSRAGAAAALEYNGDLKIANSWEWLREQFDSRYS